MLRLALIGCGSHSEIAHGKPLAHYASTHPGDVALVAACDLREDRARLFCRDYGFARAYTDRETMLEAEKPDAVACILPVEKIAEVGSELLRRGIPCVLEKPPGANPAEVARLVDAARETGTPHLVSVERRFSPYLNRALAWSKPLGPLRSVHARMLRHARREEGFIWGTGVHVIDALRYLGGEWESLHVRVIERPAVSAPWFLVSLRFASGCLGTLEVLPTAGLVEESFEISGEGFHASVVTRGWAGESARGWRDGKMELEALGNSEDPSYLRDGSYEEVGTFIRCLNKGIPLHPTVEEVAPTMEICRQIEAQARA